MFYHYRDHGHIIDNSFGDSILRFHNVLPLGFVHDASSCGVKKTPLIKSRAVARELDLANLYIKDETVHPTGTFKDREAFLNISRFKELRHDEFAMASTGHSALAHARAMMLRGGKLHIFLPEQNKKKWLLMLRKQKEKDKEKDENVDYSNVFIHEIQGSCLDGIGSAMDFSQKKNIPMELVFQNQLRVEGMKTLGFEVIEDLGKAPDWYVQTAGSGVGLFAFNKACEEMKTKKTKLAGIQPAGCSPMVNAYKKRSVIEPKEVDTHAIGIGNPKLYLSYDYLKDLGCVFEEAFSGGKEKEKKEIPKYLDLYKKDGIKNPGLEAAIELSGLEVLVKKGAIKKDETIVLCASGEMKDATIK